MRRIADPPIAGTDMPERYQRAEDKAVWTNPD
jgi:hypothetical protein